MYPVEKQFGAFSALLGAISASLMIAIRGIPGNSKPLGVLWKSFIALETVHNWL